MADVNGDRLRSRIRCLGSTGPRGEHRVKETDPAMSDFAVPEGFSVRVMRRGDAAVVVPTGELDYGSAPALEASLIRAFADAVRRVVLDLRELEFIDSGGLHVLLVARRQAEAAGKAFSLVAGHRGLERTLEIAGVHNAFSWATAGELA
jgi:anti-anti-sigma factor